MQFDIQLFGALREAEPDARLVVDAQAGRSPGGPMRPAVAGSRAGSLVPPVAPALAQWATGRSL